MQVATADGVTVAVADVTTGAGSLNLVTGKTQRFPAFGTSVAISPDGRMLAMDDIYEVLLWDVRAEREHARLNIRVETHPISGVSTGGTLAYSPDGAFLAVGTGYRYSFAPRSVLKVWQVSNLKEIGEPLFENECIITAVAFTPDSSQLIAADTKGAIRIWNTSTWQLERTIDRGSRLYSLAISPSGKTFATGGDTRTVLWDLASGMKLRVLDNTSAAALDFSPDGRTLATGNFDHSVVLWDVATGLQLRTFNAHTDSVFGVRFSPDGTKLASIGSEGVLRIWEAAPDYEIDRHSASLDSMFRLGRSRSEQERYAESEAILARLLQLQEQLPQPIPQDISETKRELEMAIRGKVRSSGKPPP